MALIRTHCLIRPPASLASLRLVARVSITNWMMPVKLRAP